MHSSSKTLVILTGASLLSSCNEMPVTGKTKHLEKGVRTSVTTINKIHGAIFNSCEPEVNPAQQNSTVYMFNWDMKMNHW